MAGQQGDHEPRQLVHRHHSGIGGLIADVGRDAPDGNAAGPYEDQRVRLPEHRPHEGCQRRRDGEAPLSRQALRGVDRAHISRSRQGGADPLRRLQPPAAESEDRQPHELLPFRNSVVKPGSYSLERRYSVPRQPPTMIRAVLVRPLSSTVCASVSTVQRYTFSSGQVAL